MALRISRSGARGRCFHWLPQALSRRGSACMRGNGGRWRCRRIIMLSFGQFMSGLKPERLDRPFVS